MSGNVSDHRRKNILPLVSTPLKFTLIIIGIVVVGVIAVMTFLFRGYTTTKERVATDSSEETSKVAANCEQISMQAPAELSKITTILYPGQIRGGYYKAHGGFRFDTAQTNDVTVVAPMAATVYEGSRYIEMGEVQYMFDFSAACDVDYRLDHLKTLSPKLQAAAEKLPAAKEGDSRTSRVSGVKVEAGEVLANEVGYTKRPDSAEPNVFFDLGVYDRRQQNEKSRDSAWAKMHEREKRLAYYAVCWFDFLPTADAALIRSLPAGDSQSGKTSDFCT